MTSTRRSPTMLTAFPTAGSSRPATHLSTDIDYRQVSDDEMASGARTTENGRTGGARLLRLIRQRGLPDGAGRACRRDRVSVQLRRGTAAVRDRQPAVATHDRPGRRTDRQASPTAVPVFSGEPACEPGNVYTNARAAELSAWPGYWWHNFFPDAIAQVIRERLDMVPANKQVGFFSDAYCVEWSFAKAVMVRKVLARVLAERIELGQLDCASAFGSLVRSSSRVHSRCWGWYRGGSIPINRGIRDGNRADRPDY